MGSSSKGHKGYTPERGWQPQYANADVAEGRRWDFALAGYTVDRFTNREVLDDVSALAEARSRDC